MTNKQHVNVQSNAPHPVAAGRENAVCPIMGFAVRAEAKDDAEAKNKMMTDPDILAEQKALERGVEAEHTFVAGVRAPVVVPLNVIGRTHHANADTLRLIQKVGGLPKLRQFTELFYQKCFADPHVDKFIRSHDDPHGERFASWICEKFGSGTPWTDERRNRRATRLQVGHEVVEVAYDRSSAHFAAWHSPKREPHKWGQHFKLEDARVWMRLHFWAAREVGLFDEHSEFMEYYVRFIGHFIRVYSSASPPFTRESVRWSADVSNTQRYLSAGNTMTDLLGNQLELSLMSLPVEERASSWPYEQRLHSSR